MLYKNSPQRRKGRKGLEIVGAAPSPRLGVGIDPGVSLVSQGAALSRIKRFFASFAP